MGKCKNGNREDRKRLALDVIKCLGGSGVRLNVPEPQDLERLLRKMNADTIPKIVKARHKRAAELERRPEDGENFH